MNECISPTTGVPPVEDPLANTPIPTDSCTDDGFPAGVAINHSSDTTYDPWVDGNADGVLALCGDFNVNAGVTVTLQKGVYVLGDDMLINGGASLVGTEVVLYFAGLTDDIYFNGGAIIDLSAPLDGPYAGMLIFQNLTKPTLSDSQMTGGSEQILDGIVYLPLTRLDFNGGSAIEESPTMLIVDTITFTGNAHMGNPQDSVAGLSPLLITSSFVE